LEINSARRRVLQPVLDHVPDTADLGEFLIICAYPFGRIRERPVPALGNPGEQGSLVFRIAAHRDNVIEEFTRFEQFEHALGQFCRQIETLLGHHLDNKRVDASCRFQPGAFHLKVFTRDQSNMKATAAAPNPALAPMTGEMLTVATGGWR
jgi:hypothetical protein